MIAFALILGAEDPTKTHHWLWPERAEIIYGGISSIIVFYLLYRFALPQLKNGLNARTDRIQKELDTAANTRTEADTEAAQIRTALGDIDTERSTLLANADAEAERLLTDGRARVEQEAAELAARADAEIAHLASRGQDELRGEISQLAGAAAEHLVHTEIDDVTHQELIEMFIARVGAMS